MDSALQPMTAESVKLLMEEAGAKQVMARSGRSEHYSAPREFSFEVKAFFPNGLCLHTIARQFNYRDPWEASGRVNDLVDVTLLRDGQLSELPKGYKWFQDTDEEIGLDEETLRELAEAIRAVNPKLYELQQLTGDL